MHNDVFQSFQKSFLRVCLAVVFATLAQTAKAQLLAYEGFDYDQGDLIEGAGGELGGGTGWTTEQSNPSDPNDMNYGWYYEYLDNPSQNKKFSNVVYNPVPADWGYTDSQGNKLPTTGGRAEVVSFGGPAVRQLDLSGVDPSLLTTSVANREEIGVDGSEVWISFLGQGTQVDSSAQLMVGGVHENTDHGGYQRAFGLGRPFHLKTDGSEGQGNEAWGMMDIQPTGTDPMAATGDSYDEKVFFVARINFDGAGNQFSDETVDVWIDPDLGATAPADADRAISDFVVYDFNFGAIELTGNANTFYDEIRIGMTYADVAPIASSTGLLADFDGDTDVDGADFLKWQTDLGGATDLANWQNEYGSVGSSQAVASAVPEPSTVLLISLAILSLPLRRGCRLGSC